METQLHRMLKAHYALDPSQMEIRVGKYRIDAIDDQQRFVEVQHAGLGSIRDKVADLLSMKHTLRIVKPIIANKWIATLQPNGVSVQRRRRSPKQGSYRDIFSELLHFTRVFPHRRLVLEVPLIDVEETRLPQKKRWRRAKPYKTVDQKVLAIGDSLWLATTHDLLALADVPPDVDFDTAMLAGWLDRPRWFAQQVAYVLKHCGAAEEVGKRGNNRLYRAVKKNRSSHRRDAA